MNKMEQYYQLLTQGRWGLPDLIAWSKRKSDLEEQRQELQSIFPDFEYWIEPGDEHITERCHSCKKIGDYKDEFNRHDAYNIFTGKYCDKCYNSSRYPYKKHRYNYRAYGERLDPDEL